MGISDDMVWAFGTRQEYVPEVKLEGEVLHFYGHPVARRVGDTVEFNVHGKTDYRMLFWINKICSLLDLCPVEARSNGLHHNGVKVQHVGWFQAVPQGVGK